MPAYQFVKRPITVEAIEWTGDNEAEVQAWAGGPQWFNALDEEDCKYCDDPEATAQVFDKLHSTWILVLTGQWVIRGVQGELYPIASSVLAETYHQLS